MERTPTSFPATFISYPQLYIEDASAFAADPHEATIIFSDISLANLSLEAFESAACQLYKRAYQYIQTHKEPQKAYRASIFGLPDDVLVGDLITINYAGYVTRDGVQAAWVNIGEDFKITGITRQYSADGVKTAIVDISNMAIRPIDTTTALSNSIATVNAHAITVGAPTFSSGMETSSGEGDQFAASGGNTAALPSLFDILDSDTACPSMASPGQNFSASNAAEKSCGQGGSIKSVSEEFPRYGLGLDQPETRALCRQAATVSSFLRGWLSII